MGEEEGGVLGGFLATMCLCVRAGGDMVFLGVIVKIKALKWS